MILSAVTGPSNRFLGPAHYFAGVDSPDRLIRHDLPLTGRDVELGALVAAVQDPALRVITLSGRGGIGETRLLRGSAQVLEAEGLRVLFAVDPALLTSDVVADLPEERTVVIVDDVHRTNADLFPLLAATRRANR